MRLRTFLLKYQIMTWRLLQWEYCTVSSRVSCLLSTGTQVMFELIFPWRVWNEWQVETPQEFSSSQVGYYDQIFSCFAVIFKSQRFIHKDFTVNSIPEGQSNATHCTFYPEFFWKCEFMRDKKKIPLIFFRVARHMNLNFVNPKWTFVCYIFW